MSSIYSISITGIKSGFSKEVVTKKLSGLMNVSEEKAAAILGSGKHIVKSGVDLRTSAKYEAALQSTGCACIVEPENSKNEILTFDLPKTGNHVREEIFLKEPAGQMNDQARKPIETTAAGIMITNDQKVIMAVVFTLIIGFFVYIGNDGQSTVVTQTDNQLVAQQAGGRVLPAGTVICMSLQSFYKVNAIEATGNSYASLPDDCMNQEREGLVEVVQRIGNPVLGDMALISANGPQAYARLRDLQ